MSIKDWVFGEVKYCKDRKCCKQFIALCGNRGQSQLYCSPEHQNREVQAKYRENRKLRNTA